MDCYLYCTLNYLNVDAYQPGQIHSLLKISGNPTREPSRLATKLKLVTDTYILQVKSSRFRCTSSESAQCLLCGDAEETVTHFILTCSVLESIPQSGIEKTDSICTKCHGISFQSLTLRCKLQLILDSNIAHEEYFKNSNFDHLSELEYESRRLCYLLHGARQRVLMNRKSLKS